MECITYETVWRGDLWRQGPQPVIGTEPEPEKAERRCSNCKRRFTAETESRWLCKPCQAKYNRDYKRNRREEAMPLLMEAECAL